MKELMLNSKSVKLFQQEIHKHVYNRLIESSQVQYGLQNGELFFESVDCFPDLPQLSSSVLFYDNHSRVKRLFGIMKIVHFFNSARNYEDRSNSTFVIDHFNLHPGRPEVFTRTHQTAHTASLEDLLIKVATELADAFYRTTESMFRLQQLYNKQTMLIQPTKLDVSDNFLNETAEKGYYDGCKTSNQDADIDLYVHLTSDPQSKQLKVLKSVSRDFSSLKETIVMDVCKQLTEKGFFQLQEGGLYLAVKQQCNWTDADTFDFLLQISRPFEILKTLQYSVTKNLKVFEVKAKSVLPEQSFSKTDVEFDQIVNTIVKHMMDEFSPKKGQ